MLSNYFLVAFRSFKKTITVSLLNLAGLSISLCACFVIFLFLKLELSIDQSHPGADRLYRLTQRINSGAHIENSSSCPYPTMPALFENNRHMIESYVRIFDFQLPTKSIKLENGQLFNEQGIYYADSTLFSIWNIPLVEGDEARVLNRPFTIVLSERLSRKYFGDANPLGRVVFLAGQDQLRCEVTGVMGEGGPSHFTPEAVISMSTAAQVAPFIKQNWVWNPCWTYLKLVDGVAPEDLETQFPEFIASHYPAFNRNMISHQLQPIDEIHLKSHLEFEMSQNSDLSYVYIFASCGILLLIIALINFINLTTILLSLRTRELGMRKVLGANRGQIVFQLFFESTTLAMIAGLVAIVLLLVFQPILSSYLDLNLKFVQWMDFGAFLIIVMAVFFVGILASIQPAVLFSKASAVNLLGPLNKRLGVANIWGKWLLVVQFAAAAFLIIFSITARNQLSFLDARDKGFSAEKVIVLDIMTTPVPNRLKAFKEAVKANNDVASITVMNELLGVNNNNHEFNHEGMQHGEWEYFPALEVDEEFLETFEIELISGRNFDRNRPGEDSMSVVINESMSRLLGYDTRNVIGQRLNSMTGNERVIGVTKDFHYKSLHHAVGPFVLDIAQRPGQFSYFAQHMAIKVDNLDPMLLKHLSNVWSDFVQNKPFEYKLLSDEMLKLYASEKRLIRLLGIFSGLAITIACIGLFALTWFIAKAKTKEIAVRKTLGANTLQLSRVAISEQIMIIGTSFLVAFPLSYLLVNYWLEGFAFRISQSAGPYVLSGTLSLGIALFTMTFIVFKTVHQNPASVMKCE